jgi:hypothetical protein
MKTENNTKEMELLVDSHHGQYIPQIFANSFGLPENFLNWDEIKEDIDFLKQEDSNEHEDYWEVWDEILNNAKLKSGFELYHNEDLWAVPCGFNWDDFTN